MDKQGICVRMWVRPYTLFKEVEISYNF